jgi:hypothetical protein
MANGKKGFRGALSDRELEAAKRQAAKGGPKNGRLKKLLGMTKRPTAAGQAKFGDVDVSGSGFKGAISDRELEEAKRAAGY